MKKGIILFIIAALIFGALAVSAFAEEGDFTDSYDKYAEISDSVPEITEIAAGTDGVEAENSGDEGNTPTDAEENSAPEKKAEENTFEYLYNLALEHSGEIFSALACIFSAVMMICYRKGILPLVKKALSIISGGVDTLSEEAQKQSGLSDSAKALIEEKLEEAQGVLDKIGSSFDAFDKRLADCETIREGEASFRKIMGAQVELLYEIFMNATLPQYEKDRIGEMIGAMRAELTKEI